MGKYNWRKSKEPEVHLGRKVQRIREIIGLKQAALADRCGILQQQISRLERRASLDDSTLERLACGLERTVAFIKNFDETRPFSPGNLEYGGQLAEASFAYLQVEPILVYLDSRLQQLEKEVLTLRKTREALQALHSSLRETTATENPGLGLKDSENYQVGETSVARMILRILQDKKPDKAI